MQNHLTGLDRSKNKAIAEARLEAKLAMLTPKQVVFINKSVISSQQRVFADAYLGRSYAKAVKAKCLDCCHGSKEDVVLCKVEICPLWATRPYQSNTQEEENED